MSSLYSTFMPSGSALWLVFNTPTSHPTWSHSAQMAPQCTLLMAIIANALCLSLFLSLSGFCRPIALHMYTCRYALIVFFFSIATCVCAWGTLSTYVILGYSVYENPSKFSSNMWGVTGIYYYAYL